jgi:hypothetical protein
MEWVKQPPDPRLKEAWERVVGPSSPVPPPEQYAKGELTALVGREPVGPRRDALEDLRWHISVAGTGRVPTWDEMVDATHSLRPGVVFCVPMPPRTWWINVHEHVLHVWEVKDANLINQWHSETARR